MTQAAAADSGQMIESRYRIVSKIADGGMASVYRAVDERLERTVAIKIMHTQLATGPHREQFVERFRREAQSAAAIANPHIVQVYDTGEFNGLDFLVMEYVHGVNLRHEMNRQVTFPVREALRLVMETLDGLAAAHRAGVVHRDIKPENILINDRGHVQITDFGLAKAASQATLSATGMLLGTAAYLAPEMIENNDATAQGDLYAVGIMAWEMLTGQVPFVSDNPVTLVFKHVHEDVPSVAVHCPGIDPAVAGFVAHLTARKVEDRPADAGVALEELRQLAATLPPEAWQYRKPVEQVSSDDAEGRVERTSAMAGAIPIPPVSEQPTQAVALTENLGNDAADGMADETLAVPVGMTTDGTGVAADAATSTQTIETQAIDVNRTEAINLASLSPDSDATGLPISDDPNATQALGIAGANVELVDTTEKPRSSRRKKAVIITLVTALVLAAGGVGGGAWWYYLGPGSYWTLPQPDDITCVEDTVCPLTDADWSSYESTLKVAGIPYEVSEDFSDDIKEGHIIAASLDSSAAAVGSHVSKRGEQRLKVTVSKGVRMATIPADILDPTSQSGQAPLDALKAAGFDNVKHDEAADQWSETLAAGVAMSVTPEPGSELKHNDEVTVVLSKGPMPVNMPDIVGKTEAEARAALDALKIKVGAVTSEFSDAVPAGAVISASQPKDAQLHWGDTVDLVLSKGPETVEVPSVVGSTTEAAKSKLESLGFKVNVNYSTRILNLVLQQSARGQVRLRDANGNPTVITLTVV